MEKIMKSSDPDGTPKENNSKEHPDSESSYIGQNWKLSLKLMPELHTQSKIVKNTVLNVTKTLVVLVSED